LVTAHLHYDVALQGMRFRALKKEVLGLGLILCEVGGLGLFTREYKVYRWQSYVDFDFALQGRRIRSA
jgi:hypothetical protein